MRIHNLYADENGETHFRDIEIELVETGPDGTISKLFPATGIIFRSISLFLWSTAQSLVHRQ